MVSGPSPSAKRRPPSRNVGKHPGDVPQPEEQGGQSVRHPERRGRQPLRSVPWYVVFLLAFCPSRAPHGGMKRRPRRLFVVLGLLACGPLVAGVAWLLWPSTAITQENAATIRERMTLAEVEAILGGPARDETTGPVEVGFLAHKRYATAIPLHRHEWQSDEVLVAVECDAEGKVWSCAIS